MKPQKPPAGAGPFRLVTAFQEFVSLESSAGLLLIICTIAALAWFNLDPEAYDVFWNAKFTARVGPLQLPSSLHYWINDGLMALFFFLVGLELKREFTHGELRQPKNAMLPVLAAIGGAVVPALIYLLINHQGTAADGWGIPMATDIAFALAVVSLLGSRVPLGLKVFLTALAIVDDLIAVLVIAVFYTDQLNLMMLFASAGLLLLAFAMNRLKVQSTIPYLLIGVALWYTVFHSGIHATIAGVLIALLIPASPLISTEEFVARVRNLLERMERKTPGELPGNQTGSYADEIHALKSGSYQVESVLSRMEHALHPYVAWLIIPLFALANAGIPLNISRITESLASPVTLGIVLGLIVGKQAGILLVSWAAVRMNLAGLPAGVSWKQLYGAACLAGIGFTMSIFIAGLAFDGTSAELLNQAKTGILAASLAAGIIGWLVLKSANGPRSAQA